MEFRTAGIVEGVQHTTRATVQDGPSRPEMRVTSDKACHEATQRCACPEKPTCSVESLLNAITVVDVDVHVQHPAAKNGKQHS